MDCAGNRNSYLRGIPNVVVEKEALHGPSTRERGRSSCKISPEEEIRVYDRTPYLATPFRCGSYLNEYDGVRSSTVVHSFDRPLLSRDW